MTHIIPASYLMLIDNENILLLRRYNTGYEDGKYSLPAGHLEPNETFKNAAIREAKEEINIDISGDDLEMVHMMQRNIANNNRIDVFFKAQKWNGDIRNLEPHKCDDLQWFPLHAIPETTIDYVKQAILSYNQGKVYNEL